MGKAFLAKGGTEMEIEFRKSPKPADATTSYSEVGEKMKYLLLIAFSTTLNSQDILGSWKLQEQYKNNHVVTFKHYLKYEFSAPNLWRSYVGDYVEEGF